MTVIQVERDRLLALFAMSQELPPFGIDYHGRWVDHCRYLDDTANTTPELGRGFTIRNADIDTVGRRPTIFITLHFDAFADGISSVARTLRDRGVRAPLTAIVGGRSTDRTYGGYLGLADDPAEVRSHGLNYVGIHDSDFTPQVMGSLRRQGCLFAVIDANQGTSEVIDAPFLYHRLNIRSGLFRLAHASRAIVQPFIVDSEAGRLHFGPSLDARQAPIRRTVEDAARFLGHHVLLRPERWIHWRHCIALSTQLHTHADSSHGSSTAPTAAGVPNWYVSIESPRLGFDTGRRRLFELDAASYQQLVGASGPSRSRIGQ